MKEKAKEFVKDYHHAHFKTKKFTIECMTDFAEQQTKELTAQLKEKEQVIEKITQYVENQKQYCNKMAEREKYTVGTYTDGNMTDEQMSGYYQGRTAANCAVLDYLETLLKESE